MLHKKKVVDSVIINQKHRNTIIQPEFPEVTMWQICMVRLCIAGLVQY